MIGLWVMDNYVSVILHCRTDRASSGRRQIIDGGFYYKETGMNTDTLTTAKELEAKGVEHAAAEAIATAIHNHTEAHLEQLVTKTDLALAVQQLEARLINKMYSTAAVAVGLLVALDRLFPG